MDFFSAMEVLASGLTGERVRMNVAASNMANSRTTRTEEGGPYQRRSAVFSARDPELGQFNRTLEEAVHFLKVDGVESDPTPGQRIFDPNHVDADPEGYVQLPNVDLFQEMVDMMNASRAYEAGVTSMRALISMAERTLSLGR